VFCPLALAYCLCLWQSYLRLNVDGVVAQLAERLVRNEKVAGSIPVGSTSLRPQRSKGEGCRAEALRAGGLVR
jgi:hypothetical protein